MIKAIILDLDGLVSDTERLHMKAYIKAFKDLGYDLSSEKYAQWWIKDGLGIVDFLEEYELNIDIEEIRNKKANYYDCYMITDLNPMPYALEFIQYFYGKLPMAIASASPRSNVDMVLKSFDIKKYMEFSLSAEDVSLRKPHPEIWLRSAEILGLDPEECLALEDAEKGILAAHKANMPCMAVPNEYTKDNDFSKSDYLVRNLNEAKDLIVNLRGEL